jgi:dihydroorotate dehydrogenase electron transfer subunit
MKEKVLPGQFVEISTPGKNSTFLKRPISVYGYQQNQIDLLYKVLGQGTQNLSLLQPGQTVDMILPLGNFFTPPSPHSKVLLIGGGIGVAPLVYYINYFSSKISSLELSLLYGAENEKQKIELNLPNPFPGNLMFHSDYKNDIYQGNLLDFFISNSVQEYDLLIACGPHPMMKAFADYFSTKNVVMEVSLESNMACGYGVCLGCTIPTSQGSKTVCTDGPVFPANQVDWTKVWKH